MRVVLLASLLVCLALSPARAQDGGGASSDGADGGVEASASPEPASATPLDAAADAPSRPDSAAEARPLPEPVTVPAIRFSGRVLERGTRAPLGGAMVTVGTATVETGRDGRFELEVTPGPHELGVQMPGYERAVKSVDVQPGSEELIVRLDVRQGTEPYETVLRPRPPEPSVQASGREARETPGALGDPFRVIESLPGVAPVVWPAALYAIRGANPGNTGFFLDGLKIPTLFHLALGPAVVHPYLIQDIEFFPGGYPARYGRYASGVVAATSAPAPGDRIHGSVDVRLYDAGGMVTAPFNGGRGSVTVGGRYSYTGAILSLFSPETTLGYGDYQLRVEHRLGPGRATLFAFGAADSLGSKTQADQNVELQFHRVDLRWDGPVRNGRLRAAVAVGADRARSTLVQSPIRVKSYVLAPRLSYAQALARNVELEVGWDAEAQHFATEYPQFQGVIGDLARSRPAFSHGAYAATTVKVGNWLVLSPAFRFDQYFEQSTSRIEPEPRLSFRVRNPWMPQDIWLKGSVGRFTQMPSLPVSVAGFEAFELRRLGPQASVQASLGVEAALPGKLRIDVTGFRQWMQVTDVRTVDIERLNVLGESLLVSRPGRSYGVELILRRSEAERVHGWLAYTLSRSEREISGVYGPSDWDMRHILNLVAMWRIGGGYSAGARFHLNTGRPVPVLPALWQDPTQPSQPHQYGIYRRLPAFYQLDVRFARRWVFDRFTLDAYLELGNVTMKTEVVQYYDGWPYEQYIKLILPSIGVRAEL